MALRKRDMKELKKRMQEEKRKEYEKVLKLSDLQLPKKGKFSPYPAEYKRFLTELKQKPTTWYEKACAFSEKILPISPSSSMSTKLKEELKTAYINATPSGVLSFAFLVTIILIAITIIGIFLGIGLTFGLFFLLFSAGVFYYFYTYPATQAKVADMRMSADTVLAILYMVIYMRSSPNLEGALKFAAENLEGPLAWDLRKLIWDIEVGVYPSADAAITNYIYKWKSKNKEFSEALHLLKGSAVEAARREILFNETINVILNGTKERTKHYAAGLKMPMMIVHAMGVLLPVMGLVLFPIILIFMSDVVKPIFIFFGYNVILPASLYFFMDYILKTKPPTFSQPDISMAKGVPPLGKFSLGKKFIPIWPFSLIISIPLIITGISGLTNPDVFTSVNFSILIIFGIGMAIVTYCILDSYQKIKVRRDVERIEDEFSVALFQLGNSISGGSPIELAIDKSRDNLKNLKIADMFSIISMNMKKFGYTFEEALFNKDTGAIWYYPSRLIHSIMRTVVESSKKSVKSAANSMIVISNYLKSVHDVKEDIKELLGDTISSMKFLAMFLAPMVAGVTVTMAVIILQILTRLGSAITGLLGAGEATAAQNLLLVPWAMSGTLPIDPFTFQLIVGLYTLQMALLLSLFLNRIQYGEDVIGERNLIGKIILVAIFVYFVSWIVVYSMFGGPISELLSVGLE